MSSTFQYLVDGLNGYLCAEHHQPVVDILHVVEVFDFKGFLHDDAPRIDVVVKEERGDACLSLAVDDRPVDGSRTTILRQQGRMHIESAETGHGPNHLGQHAESHHHLQVSLVSTQLLHKFRVLHLYRLKHGQSHRQRILLHLRGLQHILMTAHGLVGLGNHSHHVITAFHQTFQGSNRKLGRSHEHYA